MNSPMFVYSDYSDAALCGMCYLFSPQNYHMQCQMHISCWHIQNTLEMRANGHGHLQGALWHCWVWLVAIIHIFECHTYTVALEGLSAYMCVCVCVCADLLLKFVLVCFKSTNSLQITSNLSLLLSQLPLTSSQLFQLDTRREETQQDRHVELALQYD